jgi:hypothetical protein
VTCKDFDLLLPLHATGALAPDEAARVEAHLSACATCRAEAEADAAVLALAKLPPVTEPERRASAGIASGALAALHRTDRRRTAWKRVVAGIAVAAAALLAVLAPAVLRRTPTVPTAAEVATWEEPDLDTIWEDAAVLDLSASAAAAIDSAGDEDTSGTTDDALASLEL